MQVTTIMVPWYCFLIRNCKNKELSIKCVITNQSKCASGQRPPHCYWNIAWKGIFSNKVLNVCLLITNQTSKQKPQSPCEKISKMLQINFMMCNIWKLFPSEVWSCLSSNRIRVLQLFFFAVSMRMKSDWQTYLYFSKSVTVSIEELPKVIIQDQSCSSGTTDLAYVCGSNEADGKTASAYCTDCGKLMCREHEEVWIVFRKADEQNLFFNAADSAPVITAIFQLRVVKVKVRPKIILGQVIETYKPFNF